jgi:hypothetical protein
MGEIMDVGYWAAIWDLIKDSRCFGQVTIKYIDWFRQAISKEMVCWVLKSLSRNDDFKLEFKEERKWVKLVTVSSESFAGLISKMDMSCWVDIGIDYSEKWRIARSYCCGIGA